MFNHRITLGKHVIFFETGVDDTGGQTQWLR